MTVEVFASWRTWTDAEARLAERLSASATSALFDALEFASAWHGSQRRSTDDPYTWHLLEVIEVLVEGVGITDRDILVAAILHDVVEDTACTSRTIELRFGSRVAELVGWVTIPTADQDEDRAVIRRRYLDRLRQAPADALLVKLADRVSNVQRLDAHPRPAKQRSYYNETIEHIVPLARPQPWFRRWFEIWRERFSYLGQ